MSPLNYYYYFVFGPPWAQSSALKSAITIDAFKFDRQFLVFPSVTRIEIRYVVFEMEPASKRTNKAFPSRVCSANAGDCMPAIYETYWVSINL
jgi:hypothetical protein